MHLNYSRRSAEFREIAPRATEVARETIVAVQDRSATANRFGDAFDGFWPVLHKQAHVLTRWYITTYVVSLACHWRPPVGVGAAQKPSAWPSTARSRRPPGEGRARVVASRIRVGRFICANPLPLVGHPPQMDSVGNPPVAACLPFVVHRPEPFLVYFFDRGQVPPLAGKSPKLFIGEPSRPRLVRSGFGTFVNQATHLFLGRHHDISRTAAANLRGRLCDLSATATFR